MNTKHSLLLAAAILGMTGVIAGAMGAHALQKILSEQQLASFRTGVLYQMLHAPVLLWLAVQAPAPLLRWAGILITGGVVLFSGSIYLLVLATLPVGLVTPLGGMLMIAGWVSILAYALKPSKANNPS